MGTSSTPGPRDTARIRGSRSIAGAALIGLLGVALVGCAGAPGASLESTSSLEPGASLAPVLVEELGEGDQTTPVDVEVDDPVQINFRKITIRPGGGTGLHCHYGQLIAVVGSGVLTHYASIYPGGVHRYETGDSIIEGAHYVHEGKNEGTEDTVLWVTYVTPQGKPLAETDLDNCDH